MTARPPLAGLWHLALNVPDVEAGLAFYRDVLGLELEWRPDPDNAYLTSGRDNLALHKAPGPVRTEGGALDHLGFVVRQAGDVDAWAVYLEGQGVTLEKPVKTHRDGARSFYVRDPFGNLVQFIHHPPISGGETS